MTTRVQTTKRKRRIQRAGPLSSFDQLVIAVIAVLVLLIGFTVLLGDRVGVQLVRVTPLGTARSTSPIIIQFSETMDRASIGDRLTTDPSVAGEINWTGPTTLVFDPTEPLQPGEEYTVSLKPGARSEQGRELLSEYQFSFRVEPPRIAYLAPADSSPQNIWIAEVNNPQSARQITFSPSGIYDFGISPEGGRIAFAERSTNGTVDIKVIDLATNGLQQVTNCADAECTTPVWRPDGRTIAYNRVDHNTALGTSASPTRVWLIDLNSTPATTRPLIADLQVIGYNAQWSRDGKQIAFANRDEGIMVYDFDSNGLAVIPSRSGAQFALAPDGNSVVFPEIVIQEGQGNVQSYLKMANMATSEILQLSTPGEPIEDQRSEWRPDGEQLAIARRYQDQRYTRGHQIYLMSPEDGTVRPITTDPNYSNAFFSWDPLGKQLVIQRFPELTADGQPNPNGRPEIWTYDLISGQLIKIATNAFHPRWLP